MKFRVLLKSTVTTWVDVEVNPVPGASEDDLREWAANDALGFGAEDFACRLDAAGFEHDPVELAYEELDESVQRFVPLED